VQSKRAAGGVVGRRSSRRGRRSDRGVAAVEFALIVPVLALVLFGMITGGLAINQKQQMTYATREGARFASTVPAKQTFTTGTWASNIRDLIVERSEGALTAADVCVSLVEGSPGLVVSPASSYSTSGQACITNQTFPIATSDPGRRVQVTAKRSTKIEFVLGAKTAQLTTAATARSETRPG
jgi:Flp pilus assembly protein TadG